MSAHALHTKAKYIHTIVISFTIDIASSVDTRSVSSVDSETMHPPSIPKTRPSTFPSKEFLSSLVLPAPAVLKEYLYPWRDYGGDGGGRGRSGVCDVGSDRPLALKENNLLWFSTRGIIVHVYII